MTNQKRNDIIKPSSEGSKENEQEERNHTAAVSGSPQDARRLGRGKTRHQGHSQQEEEPQDQTQGKGVGRMTVYITTFVDGENGNKTYSIGAFSSLQKALDERLSSCPC